MRGGVDDRVISPVRSCRCQDVREGGGLCRDHDRILLASPIGPGFGAGLRIEIDDNGTLSRGFGGSREVDRKRGLAGTALLREDRYCFHAYILTRTHDDIMYEEYRNYEHM